MYNNDDEVFVVEPQNPVVPLDNADPEFIRGIEVGMMWQSGYYGYFINLKIHPESAEMMLRITEAFDMTFSVEEDDTSGMLIVSLFPPEDIDYDEDNPED